MIKFEDFEKVILFIQLRSEATDKINELFMNEFEDSVFYPYFKYEAAMVHLLSAALSTDTYDAEDDITYFLYELDCGKRWEPGMVTEADGTDIKMGTIKDLWDYISRRITESSEVK